MSSSVTVVWDKENFNETLNEFSFRRYFLSETFPPLFFAEFSEEIKFTGKRKKIKQMYFTDFNFDLRGLIFYTPKILLCDISNIKNLVINIVDPVDEPLPNSVNLNLKDLKQQFYASIFYKDEANVTTPLKTFKCDIYNLYEQIKSALISNGHSEFCITLGIKNERDENPQLLPASKFFEKKIKLSNLRYMMVIIVSSAKELSFFCGKKIISISSAPSQLQQLMGQVSVHLLKCTATKELKVICRRIINCCFNGGVPINLLNRFEVLTGSSVNYNHRIVENIPDNLTAQHIVSKEEITSIKLDLEQQIHNFMNHLSLDSSEAQYRSLYWDQIISTCFFLKDKANLKNQSSEDATNQDIPYKLQSEWPSLEMFPNLEERKVDYVAMFTGRDMNLMILLIEAGKEPFGFGVELHKDFSKLLAIMSKTCTKMAVDLENSGKRAEDAVVIGAWIGGHQIHFVLAKSVITRVDNLYEVNCNLYFPDQWKFDLLIPISSLTSIETSSDTGESLMMSPSDITNENFTMTDVGSVENFDTEDIESRIESDVGNEQLLSNIDDYNLTEESDSDEVRSFALSLKRNFNQGKLLEQNEINYDSMCMVRNVFDYAYDIIAYFNSSASDRGTDVVARNFLDPSSGGVFHGSRTSTLNETPYGAQTHEASQLTDTNTLMKKKIRGPSYSIAKPAESELKIYQEYLYLIPTVCPELYSTERDSQDSNVIIFHFEEMDPLISEFNGSVNDLLGFSDLETGLKGALRMILDLTHCLYILHEHFGLVHSDISPRNILYSEKHSVWKINDFDQSMNLENSILTPRVAGTKNYTAPESISNSIFTFSSDIYSLGAVLRDYVYYGLLEHVMIHEGDDNVDENLIKMFYCLEELISEMMHEDPYQRTSLICAIKGFIQLVEIFKDYKNYKKYQKSIKFYKNLKIICENFPNEPELVESVETKNQTDTRKVLNFQILKSVKI